LASVSHSVISQVELGHQRPTPVYLYAVAPHLGVRPDTLLLLAGYIDEEGRWTGEQTEPLAVIAQQLAAAGLAADEAEWILSLVKRLKEGPRAATDAP